MARHARSAQDRGRAPFPRAGTRHHRLHRRRHRRGLPGHRCQGRPPAACDRRPAHGRHERGGRPVRRGQDVPAPGGEKRACDEVRRGPPDPLHRGRKAPGRAGRPRRAQQGQDHHRHRQGRRARHRQEHRHCCAPVQQLRGGEHGRDGALPRNFGACQGRGRRHRGPVGPDHPQPRRDAVRGRRNAEGRPLPYQEDPAAHRRRHHQPGAHRREDRAALRRPRGLRARRLAQRERGAESAGRWRGQLRAGTQR